MEKTTNRFAPGAPARFTRRHAAMLLIGIALATSAGCGGNKARVASGGGTTVSVTDTQTDEPAVADADAPPATANPAPATIEVKGPNLNGSDWHGFIEGSVGYEMITATVRHIGEGIVIVTSKPTGIAHELRGRVKSSGNLVLKDPFDGQTWTTLFGPATPGHIRIADYVILNSGRREKTNILDLTRG